MISEDYKQFVNEKILDFLPNPKVRVGNKYNFRCPICGDSHKSKTKKRGWYYLDTASYFCFNCNASMSGMKFLEMLSGTCFDDIKAEYIRMKVKSRGGRPSKNPDFVKNYNVELSCMSGLKPIINSVWKNPLSEKATEYLKTRMVLDAPFLKEKLYSVYDKKQNEYILIPWKLNGVEAYYQINDFQKIDKYNRKYIFPSNTDKIIYGLDNIDITWPYIICFEGVYDSLFVKNGVCIGGKHLTNLQEKILTERYPKHQIVLSYDNDDAGLSSMKTTIENEPTKFKYFKWYDLETKEKDINDYVKFRQNTELFKDKTVLEPMIISSMEMKLFMLQKGIQF